MINDIGAEMERLKDSIATAQKEIAEIKEGVSSQSSYNEAEIFEAHWMMLEDAALLEKARKEIEENTTAQKAWMDAIELFAQMMESIPDETKASRAVDIRDVGHRVLWHLMGVESGGAE